MTRELLKVGNRELFGADFTWVVGEWLSNPRKPADITVLERREWGNFYGNLITVSYTHLDVYKRQPCPG